MAAIEPIRKFYIVLFIRAAIIHVLLMSVVAVILYYVLGFLGVAAIKRNIAMYALGVILVINIASYGFKLYKESRSILNRQ